LLDAGRIEALKRAMHFIRFSSFYLCFDVHRFSFLLILMDSL
jgi:hypothetical protein